MQVPDPKKLDGTLKVYVASHVHLALAAVAVVAFLIGLAF